MPVRLLTKFILTFMVYLPPSFEIIIILLRQLLTLQLDRHDGDERHVPAAENEGDKPLQRGDRPEDRLCTHYSHWRLPGAGRSPRPPVFSARLRLPNPCLPDTLGPGKA